MEKDNFLNYIKNKNYSNYTINSYNKDLDNFYVYLNQNNTEIKKVNYKFLRGYLTILYDKKYSKKTIARNISTLKSFFKYLKKENIIKSNPMNLIKTPKIDKKLPKFLNYDDLEKILSIPDTTTFLGKRNALILELLYSTGVRVSELVNIKLNDIDLSEEKIIILGKGNKERYVLFGRKAKEKILDYLKEKMDDSPYLIVNRYGNKISDRGIRKILDSIILEASLSYKISPHTLRHTFATHMLDSGADIEIVRELLGHESLSTTQIYTHVTSESLKRVYSETHPRA